VGAVVHGRAHAIEQAIHHLKRCRHARCPLGSDRPHTVDQSCSFRARIDGRIDAQRIGEREQFSSCFDVGRRTFGDGSKIDVYRYCFSTRTEEVGV